MELIERAQTYAVQKTDELITKAIEQAYIDGYRDGYKDRENEIPVVLTDGNVEYVDLGLPSKTLWSTDYVKEKDSILYLPYCEAKKYSIPTKEQWEELKKCCSLQVDDVFDDKSAQIKETRYICVGPNGEKIIFPNVGYLKYEGSKICFWNEVYSWLLDDDKDQNNSIRLWHGKEVFLSFQKQFEGFRMPLRLVR